MPSSGSPSSMVMKIRFSPNATKASLQNWVVLPYLWLLKAIPTSRSSVKPLAVSFLLSVYFVEKLAVPKSGPCRRRRLMLCSTDPKSSVFGVSRLRNCSNPLEKKQHAGRSCSAKDVGGLNNLNIWFHCNWYDLPTNRTQKQGSIFFFSTLICAIHMSKTDWLKMPCERWIVSNFFQNTLYVA